MNHRILFFLSIIIIAVGVVGILNQRSPNSLVDTSTNTTPSLKNKVITIAEATKALKPYELLETSDYKISTLEIDSTTSDVRDLSSLSSSNLNGYLVLNNIAKGSAIIPSLVESPESKTFLMHSLRENELPYGYTVKPQEEYLLSSLNIGDKVSLFIRVTEVEKGKHSNVNFISDGGNSPDKIFDLDPPFPDSFCILS